MRKTSGRFGAVAGWLGILVAASAGTVRGQTYRVLHSFTGGNDGGDPYAGLVRDSMGNLYGTAYERGAYGQGTVFKLDKTGVLTVLHSFTGGTDGGYPAAGLIRDSEGNFYGTAEYGGDTSCYLECGTVFKLDTGGGMIILHRFTGPPNDGSYPYASLVRDVEGNLYGTTFHGGTSNYGTVFELDTTGTEAILHSFTGGIDGGYPVAGLILDGAGDLYGTTESGTFGNGTVFIMNGAGKQKTLYSFTGGADGSLPYASLVSDFAGNLYGTTGYGGDITLCAQSGGCGTVFELDRTGKETVLYSFTGGNDGGVPSAALVRDVAGNLYGTTSYGGASGYGTVFKLDTAGTETVLAGLCRAEAA